MIKKVTNRKDDKPIPVSTIPRPNFEDVALLHCQISPMSALRATAGAFVL